MEHRPGETGPLAPKQRLPKIVWRLGWISFYADVCSEMVYPLIPLLLASIGAAPAALGFIEGASNGLVSIMKGSSGFWSDKSRQRVPFIQWGYLLSGLGKPVVGLASVYSVFAGRMLDRFGKGIRTTARDALIADAVDKDQYGRAFGFHAAMDTAGAFVGASLCWVLLKVFAATLQLKTVFLWAAIPGLIAWAITLTLKEAPHHEEGPAKPMVRLAYSQLGVPYWRALALSTIFALANSSDTFLILRATKQGFSLADAVLLYIVYNVTFTLMSYPAGALSDRIGRWALLGFGWVFYAIVYAGFAMLSGSSLWLLFALYGVYIGATQGVNKALIADLSPKEARGQALGLFYMVSGFAVLFSSLIAGWLWEAVSPAATFWFGSAAAFVAACLIPLTASLGRQKKAS